MFIKTLLGSVLSVASLTLLSGCGGSSSAKNQYTIELTNITAAQPMSPLAVVAHNSNYKIYSVGSSATVALEKLAEGGDNTVLINSAKSNSNVDFTHSGMTLIKPSSTQVISITTSEQYLSLATMLVNTNDAFTGINSYDLSSIAIGSSLEIGLVAYDAGTEMNSETPTTVPGLTGEGFNANRDDGNTLIRLHSGVITNDDVLKSSGLSSIHKFDNPVAKIKIRRMK